MAVHRRILAGAGERLVPGGRVYLEIGYDQGEPGREIASGHGEFEDVKVLKDYGGNDRVLTARKK
jgi:release factor glutamine methyltransferase